MGLLFDAAVAWDNLQNTSYYLLLGRKGNWQSSVYLEFCPEDFPHLAGMQYATDIDFGINRAEIRSNKLISKIVKGEINDEAIEKASDWASKIRGRLDGIIALESTLDSDFSIYRFDPLKVPHGTNIEAKYVIKNLHSGITFFVFLDEGSNSLKKQKRKGTDVVIDYTHPNYKPNT